MRAIGKITYWNAEKGYGFITPVSGTRQVFMHISAFDSPSHNPALDQLVTFAISRDKQRRPCARRVVLAGEKAPERIRLNDSVLMITAAVFFLIAVVFLVLTDSLPSLVLGIYLGLSALTFLAYYFDKSAARSNGQRTPEKHLHLLALAGGWPGAMVAQQKLRHKSSKQSFRTVFWVTVVINFGLFTWLFSESGSAALRTLIG